MPGRESLRFDGVTAFAGRPGGGRVAAERAERHSCGGRSGTGAGPGGVSTRFARPPLRSGPSGDTPPAPPLRRQLTGLAARSGPRPVEQPPALIPSVSPEAGVDGRRPTRNRRGPRVRRCASKAVPQCPQCPRLIVTQRHHGPARRRAEPRRKLLPPSAFDEHGCDPRAVARLRARCDLRAVARPPRGAALSRLKSRTLPARLSHRLIVHAARAVQPLPSVGVLRFAPALRCTARFSGAAESLMRQALPGGMRGRASPGDRGSAVRRFADSSRISSARRWAARRSCPCFRMRCARPREA